MKRYWLCPLTQLQPLHIGASRVGIWTSDEFTTFRQALQAIHPRLLPLFKAHLLVSDDDVCGGEEVRFDLSIVQDIVFDGTMHSLSHCAESFIHQLLRPDEALTLLNRAMDSSAEWAWTSNQKKWLAMCQSWLNHHWSPIVLAEEI